MGDAKILRILFVEDVPTDAELAQVEIRRGGLEFTSRRVDTRDGLLAALEEFQPDVIMSDYSMPEFNGMEALKLAQERVPWIPFILLTGSMNEETAVECMKRGASDYVIKEHMIRLPFAIREALEQRRVRLERDEVEQALRASEEKFRSVWEKSTDGMRITNEEGVVLLANDAYCKLMEKSHGEIEGKPMSVVYEEARQDKIIRTHQERFRSRTMPEYLEREITLWNGKRRYLELSNSFLKTTNQPTLALSVFRDITGRKRAEEALAVSEKKFRWLFDYAPVPYHVLTPEGVIADVNFQWCETLGYSKDEVRGRPIFDFILESERSMAMARFEDKKLDKALMTGRNERTYVAKDGTNRTFLVSDLVTLDKQERVTSVQTTMEDITERKRAELSLRLSEERFRSVWDNSADGMRLTDREGRIIDVNEAYCRIVRKSRKELLGQVFSVVYQRGGQDDGLSLYQKRFEKRETIPSHLGTTVLWNNETIGFHVTFSFVDTPDEERLILGLFRDATEQQKAERRLKEERNLLRTIIDAIPDEITVKDTERRFVVVNAGTLKALKRASADEIIGKKDEDLIPEHLVKEAREEENVVLAVGGRTRDRVSTKLDPATGEIARSLLVSKIPLKDHEGKVIGLVAINRDVTGLKRAEEMLEKERTLLLTLIESIPDEVCLKDMRHRYILANGASIKALGVTSLKALIGKTDEDFVPHALAQQHLAEEIAIIESGKPLLNREQIKLDPATGEIRKCALTTKVPVRDQAGKTIGILVVNREITDRKRAEESLRASEEKFRALFEESKDAVYISTVGGRLVDINPAGVELLGYMSKQELLDVNLGRDTYIDPEHRGHFQREMDQYGFVKDFELKVRRRGGGILTVQETATAVRDKLGKVVLYRGIIRDVTRQKQLEAQFYQAQKMESIGTLAGGIAHDFNNILGIVLGHLALLERTRDNETQFEESILTINKAVERGASLVRQILTFARKAEVQLEPVGVNVAIRELAKMLEETFPKTISIKLKLDKAIPVISMDPSQLHQTLLNLCVNARDAMRGQGTLSITSQLVIGRDVSIRFPKASAHHYIQVDVSDTGIGMDEETKRRIFEPFFTTKEKGKGTGLGLAVVYGVLQTHNGFVDVESTPGAGTTFHLFLPVPAGIVWTSEKKAGKQADLLGGTETILVVEDEDVLRDLLVTLLEERGYRVITASDGEEAVRLFGEHEDQIDLLLSDIGMPKRSGWEAYEMMRQTRPGIRALLATGYIDPDQKSEFLKSGVKGILTKPYRMDEVLKAVRATLDQKE